MLRFVALGCLLVSAIWAVPHDKIAKIFADMDYNENDVIIQNEIISYMEIYKTDPHDKIIVKERFVRVWMQKYKDTTVMAQHIYSKLDANGDGILTDSDIPILFFQLDKNHNGIEWFEFEKAFNAWYSEI
ncbi:uncharacterized protein LOC135471879 [Liolophura sinensis]|uniref:uncharacterized protein LOC135471879 n=1 Tax=Liolophura sinensis TaxID=3198878 RepID=UPI003158AEBA